jgi:hypothetical protein
VNCCYLCFHKHSKCARNPSTKPQMLAHKADRGCFEQRDSQSHQQYAVTRCASMHARRAPASMLLLRSDQRPKITSAHSTSKCAARLANKQALHTTHTQSLTLQHTKHTSHSPNVMFAVREPPSLTFPSSKRDRSGCLILRTK